MYQPASGAPVFQPPAGYAVVNNTLASLSIFQDGRLIAKDLKPGEVLPIRALLFQRYSTIVVTGYRDSFYVGSSTFTFDSRIPETWSVQVLDPPM